MVGAAIAVTLALLIIQLTNLDTAADQIKAAAAAAGTIVEGGAVAFLVKRQNEAKRELAEGTDLIDERCPPAAA